MRRLERTAQLLPLLVTFLAGLALDPLPLKAQCPCATLSNLDTLGGNVSGARGVSADGTVVVGYSNTTGNLAQHAFRWDRFAGMVDLGTFGGSSLAQAISGDGNVIGGNSDTAAGAHKAFRWTSTTGLSDLGSLGGDTVAYGTNRDGSTVVGGSNSRAFRWTAASGMQDIGAGSGSAARGVSADGSVVVGAFDPGTTWSRAFRWTATTGIQNLGTLGNLRSNSFAYAVSSDGSVVVGQSDLVNGMSHAFRWTAQYGMVDLGSIDGSFTQALAVNATGSVVVGRTGLDVAFRWTAMGGMQDLNNLLAQAGVNMNAIRLSRATGVSADGQFIVGDGQFIGSGRAFIARYIDATIDGALLTPIAGVTTLASAQTSVDELAIARRAAGVQQHSFAAPLLGADKPMAHTSEVGAFGSVGSLAAGAAARYAFGDGFAILGGLSYSQEDYQNVEVRNATTGALALRYAYSSFGAWQPFIEGGGWVSPHASMHFTRTYANGAGLATGVGSTDGTMTYAFGRAGVAIDLDRRNQLALSGEYGRERMTIRGYAEPLSSTNPFEARVTDSTETFDMLKAKAQYTINLSNRIDTTLWAAAVRSFNQTSSLSAAVAGIGTLSPSSNSGTTWAEYGARVGYKMSSNLTFDLFSAGISGRDGIGTQVHSGIGARIRF